ncbi:MAG: hypothetical protein IJ009_03175 [Clostridia bacterium]|nr:hypothetical protein [Clostridia bacterium]
MENRDTFTYQYSAKRNREVENIRKKYMPKEENKLDTLRALDRRVQSAGQLQGLTLGILGCLLFGIGMCFGLGVFAGVTWLSIPFGIIGIAVMIPAYPVSRHIARKTKTELTPRILQLSEEIMRS